MIDCEGGNWCGSRYDPQGPGVDRGASIRLSSAGGLDLTPEAVLFCLHDPEAFEAWTCGGTVDQLRAWYDHDWKCRAHTRSQRRCKNWVAVVEQGRCYNAPEPGFGELEDFHPVRPRVPVLPIAPGANYPVGGWEPTPPALLRRKAGRSRG